MKVTKGHLTTVEKKHIKIMLEQGLQSAKINRKTYNLQPLEENSFRVSITENKTDWCEVKPRLITTIHEFQN